MTQRKKAIVQSRMAVELFNLGTERLNNAKIAVAYCKSRYPKLFSLVKQVNYISLGQYNYGNAIYKQGIININPLKIRPIEELINTVMHEVTHCYQYYSDNEAFNSYVKCHRRSMQRFKRYSEQTLELQARQAGNTAKKSYEEFKRIQ